MKIALSFLLVFVLGCASLPQGSAPSESYSHSELPLGAVTVAEMAVVEVIKRARMEGAAFSRVYLVSSEPVLRSVNKRGGFGDVEVVWYMDRSRQGRRFWKDASVLDLKEVWTGKVPNELLHLAKEKERISAAAILSIRFRGEGQNAGYLILFSKERGEWIVAEVVKQFVH